MLESISPYELLRASIPKPLTEKNRPYDQFSTNHAFHASDSIPASSFSTEKLTIHPASQPFVSSHSTASSPQTHYIADIRRRHDSALKKTVMV